GGAKDSALNNCTLTGNSTAGDHGGGGVYATTLNNCIVYFNTAQVAANYDSSCTMNYCCTTPLAQGSGNLSADPQLASSIYLRAAAPCRGAGTPSYATGSDIDGEPWAVPPSIGCDEYHAGAATGALDVAIAVGLTNVAAGYPVELTGQIGGRAVASVWDFGDN